MSLAGIILDTGFRFIFVCLRLLPLVHSVFSYEEKTKNVGPPPPGGSRIKKVSPKIVSLSVPP